jgi:hypothetical protein
MDYQTRDGLADYGFSIEFQPDVGWRVYILFEPLFLDNIDSLNLPYQAIDGNGRRYVDWRAKSIAWQTQKRLPRFGPSCLNVASVCKNKESPLQRVRAALATRSAPIRQTPDTRTAVPSSPIPASR